MAPYKKLAAILGAAILFASPFVVSADVVIDPTSGATSDTDLTINGAYFFAVIPPNQTVPLIISRAENGLVGFNIHTQSVVSGSPAYFNIFGTDPGSAGDYYIFAMSQQNSPCWADYPDMTYACLHTDGTSEEFTFHANGAIGGGGGGGGGGGSCGLGCAGTPTLYTAGFGSSTAQAAAVSAATDLSSFLWYYLPKIILIIISLIAIGTILWFLKREVARAAWDRGFSTGADNATYDAMVANKKFWDSQK